ncbi:PaaI family thioesterase [Mesobacillus foraminis]|uniref:Uncharacterized protein (TIGR00369 family) n=1 Tax=Mesobacillus foraminis TaxID=279826 RepID=A0A4R2BI84_9BACI|nr:PaaI family thioesterase [Mesobacillus foraminis]TCN25739.1 uncharacterized protein (TIGR00369 family) [Mesobacillus foraminis]
MKETELQQLLEECQTLAGEEDLEILKDLLTGVRNKLRDDGNYLGHILGMEGNLEGDTFELTLPLTSLVNNHLGILHGGITATVIDSAMGILANKMLPKGTAAVTTQLNIHYIAPGTGRCLNCSARVVHRGTKTMVMEADIRRDDGTKIAHATGSFFIVKK